MESDDCLDGNRVDERLTTRWISYREKRTSCCTMSSSSSLSAAAAAAATSRVALLCHVSTKWFIHSFIHPVECLALYHISLFVRYSLDILRLFRHGNISLLQFPSIHFIGTVSLRVHPPLVRTNGDFLDAGGVKDSITSNSQRSNTASQGHSRIDPPSLRYVLNDESVDKERTRHDGPNERTDTVLVKRRRAHEKRIVELDNGQETKDEERNDCNAQEGPQLGKVLHAVGKVVNGRGDDADTEQTENERNGHAGALLAGLQLGLDLGS